MNAIETSPDIVATEAGAFEDRWPLQSITLAGKTWPARSNCDLSSIPVVMVHGWLDNCLSFSRLAPELSVNRTLHGVDLAGHGLSGSRPSGQSYLLMDYVVDLAEMLESHIVSGAGQSIDLVGHSLGGAICALYAAAVPERVRKLVMIDSLGALSRPSDQTASQLRKAIDKRLGGSRKPTVYADIKTAARVRSGGFIPLSQQSAEILTERNLKPRDGGFVWRTDSRLRHPSPLMMTEKQVQETLRAIQCPTLFIKAEQGLLATRKGLENREAAVAHLKTVRVPGGHHCHLDGDIRPVSQSIKTFLSDD
ncbi:alpha/beta hydrolase [Marinobacter sp. chi1]|uniref:Alpha/beta hydrolase n=1 Tax=Marinobacter suaedae TaxID=3057675 RepID=A0ABT8W280_9GAMM|nr:alpha/beta hydrolase [Marinobacter sp. chi1]MDO3722345.1 alpha/beta hydrolase [Marinobacter sp. chi1]